jgi:hypothetical protein
MKSFNIPGLLEDSQSGPKENSQKVTRLKWTDSQFKSTTTKKEVVWKMVAGEMEKQNLPYTSTQCHNKWRYLKSKYAAKKDNMSARPSGSDRMDFKYFELMDAFLGKKHNIRPIAVVQ